MLLMLLLLLLMLLMPLQLFHRLVPRKLLLQP